MLGKCVSVIIPTYNRGYILEQTIPSYIQENVAEIIVVDDCSTDNTCEIVKQMIDKYLVIKYFRNETNIKQTGSKNKGMKEAKQSYIYFGDDDSILLPGTISHLLSIMIEKNADVVGAVPLYADTMHDIKYPQEVIARKLPLLENIKQKFDVSHIERIDFFYRLDQPVQLPFIHACALVKSSWAKKAVFDEGYKGNSYREETDYFLQLSEKSAKIYFSASDKAVQINFPFSEMKRIRTFKSMYNHCKWDLINTIRLIKKHHWFFKRGFAYQHGVGYMICSYIVYDLIGYFKILPRRLYGMAKNE